jgi:hypothetical protein
MQRTAETKKGGTWPPFSLEPLYSASLKVMKLARP